MDIISSQSFRERGYFDTKKVLSLYNQHNSNNINCARDIWKCMNLELWFKEYIDS